MPDSISFVQAFAEVKAIRELKPVERALVLHYLKVSGNPVRVLLNFVTLILK